MIRGISNAISDSLRRLQDFPQLWLTIVIAVAIFGSFVYMADRFIAVAQSAQERLTNVRVGALQDAFVPLVAEHLSDQGKLTAEMKSLADKYPTIVEFSVLRRDANGWTIVTDIDPSRVGTNVVGKDQFLSFAVGDTENAYTVEEVGNNSERFFRTIHAVTDASSTVVGVLMTRQTLSEADRAIASSVQSSIIALIVILIVLLVLFLRHARIVDYIGLYHRLEEVDKLKDDFVAMASHELRTPLTAVRGYVFMLGEELKGRGSGYDKEQALIAQVDASASTLNDLISDMLDVSRIEQGRMSYTLVKMDPHTVIKDAVNFLSIKAKEKQLAIETDYSATIQSSLDSSRLKQIVLNLVGNAIKYSPKGTITIRTYDEKERFVLRVSDTGIGMTADELAHLFGKFYRATGEEVRSQTGTGLGLWITKQMVETMHGTISVESIKGVGTHFVVSFPKAV